MDTLDKIINQGYTGSWLDTDDRQPKISNPTPGTISAANVVSSADTKTGLSLPERANLSFLTTPKNREDYLKNTYGEGKVLNIDGDFYVNKNDQWIKADEEQFGLRDLVDYSGEAISMAPGLAVGLMTDNPWLAGMADAGGDALRQAMATAIPGAEPRDFKERAMQSLLAGTLGGATQGVFNVLGRAGSSVPGIKNEILKEGERGISKPFTEGTEDILDIVTPPPTRSSSPDFVGTFDEGFTIPAGENTGIDQMVEATNMRLSAGDLSQNPYLKRVEGALRQQGRAEVVMNQADKYNERALYDYLKDISEGVDPEVAGAKIKGLGENYFNSILQRRRDFAGVLFDQAAEESGGAELISPENYYNAIKELSSEYLDNPLVSGFDPMVKKAQEFENVAKNLFQDNPPVQEFSFDPSTLTTTTKTTRTEPELKQLTVAQLQKGLQSVGDIAAGKGKLMEDLTTAEQRRFAGYLKSALERDLDEAVKQEFPGAATLRKARDRWKKYTNFITNNVNTRLASDLEKSVFGEDIMNKIINNKIPAKARGKMVEYLKRNSPSSVTDLKRALFQKILNEGVPAGTGMSKRGAPFSPEKGLTALMKRSDLVEDLYRGDTEGWLQLQNAITGMKVLGSRLGISGSQTAPMQWAMELIKQSKFNPLDLMNSFLSYRKPEAMARMLTGSGFNSTRESLAELARPNVKTKAVLRALENMFTDSQKYQMLEQIGEYGNVPETREP